MNIDEQFLCILDDCGFHANSIGNQARALNRAMKEAKRHYLDADNVTMLRQDLQASYARLSAVLECMEDTIKELKTFQPYDGSAIAQRGYDSKPRRASGY